MGAQWAEKAKRSNAGHFAAGQLRGSWEVFKSQTREDMCHSFRDFACLGRSLACQAQTAWRVFGGLIAKSLGCIKSWTRSSRNWRGDGVQISIASKWWGRKQVPWAGGCQKPCFGLPLFWAANKRRHQGPRRQSSFWQGCPISAFELPKGGGLLHEPYVCNAGAAGCAKFVDLPAYFVPIMWSTHLEYYVLKRPRLP